VVQLVQVVFSWEKWAVAQHLGEDAAHGPDVDRFRVALTHGKQNTSSIGSWNKEFYCLRLERRKYLVSWFWARRNSTNRALTFEFSMISGALYHRVATYSVRNPVWSWSGSATLAKPKSHICKITGHVSNHDEKHKNEPKNSLGKSHERRFDPLKR
jgi:hypothetical protein